MTPRSTAAVAGLVRVADELGVDAVRRARHRLEHVELVTPAQIATLARLGVAGSVQPAFDAAWGGAGELYEQRLGRERAATMNPLADWHRSGGVVAYGTDAPVTPLAGWAMVADAVRHSRPDQRVGVGEAFAAATRGGHLAAGDTDAGLLVPGQRAHLALWDAEPGSLDEVADCRIWPRARRSRSAPDCWSTDGWCSIRPACSRARLTARDSAAPSGAGPGPAHRKRLDSAAVFGVWRGGSAFAVDSAA